MKTISASVLTFVSLLMSIIALGEIANCTTHGAIGIHEYLLMNSVAGIIHTLIGCQPLLVLRSSCLVTVILGSIYQHSQMLDVPFYPFLAWIGVFVGALLLIIALFELSDYMRVITRFTQDTFSFFVSTLYLYLGWTHLQRLADHHPHQESRWLVSDIMCLSIVAMTMCLASAATARIGRPCFRRFLVEYAAPLSLLVGVVVACHIHMGLFKLYFVPAMHSPSSYPSYTNSIAEVYDGLEMRGIMYALLGSLPITCFLALEQYMSSSVMQRPEMKLSKGSYYHSPMLCVGAFNIIGPFFGLPFIAGSVPHSPQLVLALSDLHVETGETVRVQENRVAPLLAYSCLALLLIAPLFTHYIPEAGVAAILFTLGISSLQDLQMYERFWLLFTQSSMYPQGPLYTKVKPGIMHMFTLVQFVLLGWCWIIQLSYPLMQAPFIVCFAALRRWALPRFFRAEDLELLDSFEEGEPPDDTVDPEKQPLLIETNRRFGALYRRA